MRNYKIDIKILRILYAIIIILCFVLYFSYQNNKTIDTSEIYKYTITNIDEQEKEITYTVSIDDKYSDETLTKICEEIKQDYIHLYKINEVYEKVDVFNIKFYYNDTLYKELGNKK